MLPIQDLGALTYGGAEGPNTFDCSGLVKWCYAKAGKSLPHSSSAMSIIWCYNQYFECTTWGYLMETGPCNSIGGNLTDHAPQTGDVVKVSSGVSSFAVQLDLNIKKSWRKSQHMLKEYILIMNETNY